MESFKERYGIDWDIPGGVVKLCQDEQMTITTIPQPERAMCDYCTSYSLMDARGNCCCCGAPRRPNAYIPQFLLHTDNPLVSNAYIREKFLGAQI